MNLDVVDATAEALPLELLNNTNKELTAQLTRFEQQLEERQGGVEDQRRRLQFMKEHLGNVRAEIVNTQSLSETKKRELESEESMCRVMERECARLQQRQTQLERSAEDVRDRLTSVQDRIFHGNLKIEELKTTLDYNQEELEQWDEARRQKEEDELAIARYCKLDEAKVKQLTQHIEKLETTVRRQRKQLDEEMLATQHVQGELDRVANEYRKLHDDRSGMLDEWEQVVRTIAERDEAIRIAAEQYADGVAWIQKRQQLKKSLSESLEEAKEETAVINYTIQEREKTSQKLQEAVPVLTQQVQSIQDEVDALREEASRATRDKRAAILQLQETITEIERRNKELTMTEKRRATVAERLKEEEMAATDLQKQADFIAQLLKDAETASHNVAKDIEQLKTAAFKANQELSDVRAAQTTTLGEISGAQAQGKNYNAKINQLDGESFSQQGVLYNIEFSVQQMEKRVGRAKGERTEEERKELHGKIDLLQATLDELEKQNRILQNQVKRVREEMRQSTMLIEKLEMTKKRSLEEVLERDLHCTHDEREEKKLEKQREDLFIKVDTLELQLRRMRNALRAKDAELLTLEEKKRQLEADVAEREAEIEVHHRLLKMEAKLAEEERKRLVTELLDRQKNLTAVKNRQEVLVGRMDPAQARLSQVQLVIAAAKEREDLQYRGDSLDTRIRRMEKEMLKLEKTIAVIKASNAQYKHKFDKVSDKDEEVQTQKALTTKFKELKSAISRRALEANDFQATTRNKQEELRALSFEKERVGHTQQQMLQQYEAVTQDILTLRETSVRYDQTIGKAKENVDAAVARDVELVCARERLDNTVAQLLSLSREAGDEVLDVVKQMLAAHQLSIESA
ncbi:TPR/MLP1/MLP2-like protein, putative [Leishmania donovani]|uniref:TPR/MLP1/MLP2-like protein, putative n=1 Tax=Leishmania donovani TaxID=5661 RepID=A0A3Q8IFA9_LEIDO|nr:TPR/MLP1/MLP2-like protein, putative [Leishmania donovani]